MRVNRKIQTTTNENRPRAALVRIGFSLALTALTPWSSGCSSMKSFMAIEGRGGPAAPIGNPFQDFAGPHTQQENIVLRTKKGDRAVEVELPGSTAQMTDFQIPLSPAFGDGGRRPAGVLGAFSDETGESPYKNRAPSLTDREIAETFPQGQSGNEVDRHEIESSLGLVEAEDPAPQSESSYLAAIDHVKQLFRSTRYEAALLELDSLLKSYPTDPKIYEMRGTLLDRLGRTELALKSWNQALRLKPDNASLRKFVERRSSPNRGIASP